MENNSTIDVLNSIITDIEAQLEVRGCKKKIVYLSSNPELKAYNSGMLDGARIALRVINERIGHIQKNTDTWSTNPWDNYDKQPSSADLIEQQRKRMRLLLREDKINKDDVNQES